MTRFWNKVHKTDTCWLWTAGKLPAGYGRIRIKNKNILAHRYAYENLVGPISASMTVDHLCLTKACVNPSHMEIVTLSENVRRARSWEKSSVASGLVQSAKKGCPKGHPYDSTNTYITPLGRRDCRECRRAACRRHYHRNKGLR